MCKRKRKRESATHGLTRVKSSITHHYIHFIILFTSLNIDLGIFELFSFRIACRLLRQKMNILLIFVYAVVVFVVTVAVVAVAICQCGACLRNHILFMIYYFDIQLDLALLTISLLLNKQCVCACGRMRNKNKAMDASLVCLCLQNLTQTGITLASLNIIIVIFLKSYSFFFKWCDNSGLFRCLIITLNIETIEGFSDLLSKSYGKFNTSFHRERDSGSLKDETNTHTQTTQHESLVVLHLFVITFKMCSTNGCDFGAKWQF